MSILETRKKLDTDKAFSAIFVVIQDEKRIDTVHKVVTCLCQLIFTSDRIVTSEWAQKRPEQPSGRGFGMGIDINTVTHQPSAAKSVVEISQIP